MDLKIDIKPEHINKMVAEAVLNSAIGEQVEAWTNLRHYPGGYHMEEARKAAPEVFGDWEDMKHD